MSESEGFCDPGVPSESVLLFPWLLSCTRACFYFVNIITTYQMLHTLKEVILRTRTGTVVLFLMWGLGSRVNSQVKIRYIKFTLKKSLRGPFYHFLTYQAQVLVALLMLVDIAWTPDEVAGLPLGAMLHQNVCTCVCMCVHVCLCM